MSTQRPPSAAAGAISIFQPLEHVCEKRTLTPQRPSNNSLFVEKDSLIAKAMKRTPGALRQKALSLGLALGHRR
jgi:hypothetical protein